MGFKHIEQISFLAFGFSVNNSSFVLYKLLFFLSYFDCVYKIIIYKILIIIFIIIFFWEGLLIFRYSIIKKIIIKFSNIKAII